MEGLTESFSNQWQHGIAEKNTLSVTGIPVLSSTCFLLAVLQKGIKNQRGVLSYRYLKFLLDNGF